MLKNLSSAEVVIGALRVNVAIIDKCYQQRANDPQEHDFQNGFCNLIHPKISTNPFDDVVLEVINLMDWQRVKLAQVPTFQN